MPVNKRKSDKKRNNKTNKRRSQYKKRGGAGTLDFAPYGGMGQQHAMIGKGNEIAPLALGGSALSPAVYGGALPQLAPSKVGGSRKQRGAGVLNDLALPALLVYANNMKTTPSQLLASTRRRFSRSSRSSRRRR